MREISRQRAKFVEVADVPPDKLSICSYGHSTTGKTNLIGSMPDPVGVIPLDRKTRRTLAKLAQESGKKILFPNEDFIRHLKPMELAMMKPEEAITYYTTHKNKIFDAIYSFAERSDIQSIAIDSGTQLWEDILFSHFGRAQRIMPRDRGPANQDIRDVMNSLQDKHVIVTHQASEIWRNEKPTGKFEWAGYSRMDYYCNVVIEHKGPPDTKDFEVWVRLCQDRPDLIGENVLQNEDINFTMLATAIYPEGGWE